MMLTKKSRLSAPVGVNISTGPRWARSDTLDHRPQAVDLVREEALLQLRALVGLFGLTCERRLEYVLGTFGRDHGHAVGVENDQVAWADRAPGHLDRNVQFANDGLGGTARPDPARPNRQPHLRKLFAVANRGVHENRGSPVHLRLGGEQVTQQ